MSAHTPGPWRVSPYGDVEVAAADRGDGALLAAVRFMGNGEERANARLIAAAPDLLAALKAVVDHFVGDHHRDDCPGHLDHDGLTVLGPLCRDHRVAEMADAAIARAEGKSK